MDKKLAASFKSWNIPDDFADPMANYLVNGWHPGGFMTSMLTNDCWFGGFMTAMLANDCWCALGSANHAVSADHMRALMQWVVNTVPPEARGSYTAVEAWIRLDKDARRKVLEDRGLVMTAWEHLKDTGDH